MADTWEDIGTNRAVRDNWDDEENENNVKDDWDAEEPEEPKVNTVTKPKPSTKAQTEVREMTEEEKKEAQIKSDLSNATELFGLNKSLDEIKLNTKEDCTDYVNRLYARLNTHNKSSHYLEFLDELFKSLSKNLNSDAIKKLSNSLKLLSDAKLAEERANKPKPAKPGSKKAPRIKLEADRIKSDFDVFLKDSHRAGYVDEDNDDDDFM